MHQCRKKGRRSKDPSVNGEGTHRRWRRGTIGCCRLSWQPLTERLLRRAAGRARRGHYHQVLRHRGFTNDSQCVSVSMRKPRLARTTSTSCRNSSLSKWRRGICQQSVRCSPSLSMFLHETSSVAAGFVEVWKESTVFKNELNLLPKQLDKQRSALRFPALGATLTVFTQLPLLGCKFLSTVLSLAG